MLISNNAMAGAANADLNCKSIGASKPVTLLVGSIPGDFAEFDLVLKHGNKSITMKSEKDHIGVITNFTHKVFTISVMTSNYERLSFYAIPKSIKYKGGASRLYTAKFTAILVSAPKPGTKTPRYTSGSFLKGVKMNCTLHHST